MLDWLKTRTRGESGAILIVVAGLMVVIIAAAALAIDIGSFYKDQRRAQAAADAAALAASQDLPSATQAETDGTNYGTTNYPGASVTVTPGTNNVKATVTAQSPAFFGQFFGLTSATVSASAVAGDTGGASPAAIFSNDANCSHSDVTIGAGGNSTANNSTINGAVISNGAITDNGNNNSISTATYGGPNGCTVTTNGSNDTFGSTPTETTALTPFPVDYSTDVPACTETATTWDWSKQQGIPSGTSASNPIVYCGTTINISASNMPASANVVFEATNINITGNHLSFTNASFIADNFTITSNNLSVSAPSDGLLFYDESTSPLILGSTTNGGNNSLAMTGAIYAPQATVEFEGNTTGSGFVEAEDVSIFGNSFNVTGTGPVMGGGHPVLIQ